jgi:hypothetical protein
VVQAGALPEVQPCIGISNSNFAERFFTVPRASPPMAAACRSRIVSTEGRSPATAGSPVHRSPVVSATRSDAILVVAKGPVSILVITVS